LHLIFLYLCTQIVATGLRTIQFLFSLKSRFKKETYLFFCDVGIFFAKLAFSAVICGIRLHLHLTSI
jgi:hypothetical protein